MRTSPVIGDPYILRRMRKPGTPNFLIALLCVALIFARIGGAHLHLCLDGGEPPVSLHVADSGIHHAEEAVSAPHADQDLAIGQDLVVKKPFGDLDPALLAFALAFLVLLALRGGTVLPEFLAPPFSRPRARLRPPLRGPPR